MPSTVSARFSLLSTQGRAPPSSLHGFTSSGFQLFPTPLEMAAVAATTPAPALSSLSSSTLLRPGRPTAFPSCLSPRTPLSRALTSSSTRSRPPRAVQETKDAEADSRPSSSDAEETTLKYGLELGLWKIFTSKGEESSEDLEAKPKSKADQAKELLGKYGGAYLATSISLSAVSFAACYLLVSAGVDVQGLLQQLGITVDEAGGKVGTFALAYAAHKAASPIRFPPTVALTPVVAGWIGKKTVGKEKGAGDGSN